MGRRPMTCRKMGPLIPIGGQPSCSGVTAVASKRPPGAAVSRKATVAPTAICRLPSTIAVQWKAEVGPGLCHENAEAAARCRRRRTVPTRGTRGAPGRRRRRTGTTAPSPSPWRSSLPVAQWTIFAIASSMMSVAPRSLRAGIKMLISDLGHDRLDRVAGLAEQLGDGRRTHGGKHGDDARQVDRRDV